jgi:uncharacterized protein (DUF305 family)
MPGRVAWWAVVALLAASCTSGSRADTTAPATSDQTDVWFMQHMVPHLRQKTAIVSLTRARISHPRLGRLVDAMARRDQADSDRLLGWFARRGLAPHGHSHQRVDNRQPTDLERLARLRGTRLDRSFLEVMLARDRAGIALCLAEVRHGRLADVRQLARRMLADQQREVRQLRAWRRTWSTAATSVDAKLLRRGDHRGVHRAQRQVAVAADEFRDAYRLTGRGHLGQLPSRGHELRWPRPSALLQVVADYRRLCAVLGAG